MTDKDFSIFVTLKERSPATEGSRFLVKNEMLRA